MEDGFPTLHTTLAPEALKEKLRHWEPWMIRLDFDNGVSTRDCARLTPFVERPLNKFAMAASALPFAELAGGRLLDVGSNAGYNSIHAAVKYGFFTTGIDYNPRHIEIDVFWPAWQALRASSSWTAPRRSAVLGNSMLFFISGRSIICPTPFSRSGRLWGT